MRDKINKKHKTHKDNNRNSKYGHSANTNDIANLKQSKKIAANENINHQKPTKSYFHKVKSLFNGLLRTAFMYTTNAASIVNQMMPTLEQNQNITTMGAASIVNDTISTLEQNQNITTMSAASIVNDATPALGQYQNITTMGAASIVNDAILALTLGQDQNITTMGATSEAQAAAGVTPLATGLATGGAGMVALTLLGLFIKGCVKSEISVRICGAEPCLKYTPIKTNVESFDDNKLQQLSKILKSTAKQKYIRKKRKELSNADNIDGSEQLLESPIEIDEQKKQEIASATNTMLSNAMSKHNPYKFTRTCAPRAKEIAQDTTLLSIVKAADIICNIKTNKKEINRAVNTLKETINTNDQKHQNIETLSITQSPRVYTKAIKEQSNNTVNAPIPTTHINHPRYQNIEAQNIDVSSESTLHKTQKPKFKIRTDSLGPNTTIITVSREAASYNNPPETSISTSKL